MKTKVLQEANDIIHGARRQSYGSAVDSFTRIGVMWGAYLGLDSQIAPKDVAMMMVLLKTMRESAKHDHDNLVDIAGYAALAEECAEEEE